MLEIKSLRSGLFGPLDLQVQAGECVAILGKSGSGKSLFLRAIADLDPNHGEIWLDGTERATMSAPEWRHQVVFMPAESGWWADIVGEHMNVGAGTDKMLADLGFPPDVLTWQVARLSTGERQRLAIVRALAAHPAGRQPKVLMFDEPTAALDQEATAMVERQIRRQLAAGRAVILVTHDKAQAERVADETLYLVDGKLVQQTGSAP